ncbi:MAG: hypothetical protein M9895_04400 [Aquamicrobium sp.]|uniref:hypothetical protein n=1 Tax=Aquamicrobium sp. TaxID=1872579 RepID=UPI00349EE575|nr:hypothetical protein [Aquamicrobium sp.]MCO5157951.1 hypothetical protein [Aquamicrobium sp.]
MPKFRVVKGHDAWAKYATTVEAETAEEADVIAMDRFYEGAWEEDGVAEFDDYQLMEGETEEIKDEGEEHAETA